MLSKDGNIPLALQQGALVPVVPGELYTLVTETKWSTHSAQKRIATCLGPGGPRHCKFLRRRTFRLRARARLRLHHVLQPLQTGLAAVYSKFFHAASTAVGGLAVLWALAARAAVLFVKVRCTLWP